MIPDGPCTKNKNKKFETMVGRYCIGWYYGSDHFEKINCNVEKVFIVQLNRDGTSWKD